VHQFKNASRGPTHRRVFCLASSLDAHRPEQWPITIRRSQPWNSGSNSQARIRIRARCASNKKRRGESSRSVEAVSARARFREMDWKDSPFNIYPEKGHYMWRVPERVCETLDLPFRRPSHFPRGSLLAARIVAANACEPWIPSFVRAVYSANFADDRDIGSIETVANILQRLRLDAKPIVSSGETAEAKARLRINTDDAVSKGIFGAPSFVVDGELFWG
jgi:hypothetical protein